MPHTGTCRRVHRATSIGSSHVYESKDYLRYNCPWCVEIRGKEDKDAKLYYNKILKVGFCFKCESVVVGDNLPALESIHKIWRAPKNNIDPTQQSFDLSGWTRPVQPGSAVYKYLTETRNLSHSVIEKYQFRESDLSTGVIIPNPTTRTDPYITDFCQIRYFGCHSLRYVSPTGAVKPLYGYLFVRDNEDCVIVCEGSFSAISASQSLNIPAVGLFGKSISAQQVNLLRDKHPKSVLVMLDGMELTSGMKVARTLSTFTEVYMTFLESGKDPAETENLRDRVNNFTIKYSTSLEALIEFELKRCEFIDTVECWDKVVHSIFRKVSK